MHIYNSGASLALKLTLALALVMCGLAQGLRAQSSGDQAFTITNGHYYWFDGRESDSDNSKYLTGWDRANGWKGIYLLGAHSTESTTEIVEQGTQYLVLDLSNPNDPKVGFRDVANGAGFDSLCVWYRTGNTGYYYQTWGDYTYYLYAHHSNDPDATDLSIYKVASGLPLAKKSTWYNWDHGMAIEEVVDVPGGKKTMDFWLIFDTLDDASGEHISGHGGTPQWRMSKVNCYQRPEEFIYENYRSDNSYDNRYYYDNVAVGPVNFPAGVAATFMPVEVTEHPKHISSMTGGMGLTSVETDVPTVAYGESIVATANVHTSQADNIASYITNAYKEYREETYRRGINLVYGSRTTNTFGSAGVPTIRKSYSYSDGMHDDEPNAWQSMAEVDSVRFTLDSRSSRYLSLSATSYDPNEISNVNINVIDSMEDAGFGLGAICVDGGYTTPENPYDYYGWLIWSNNPDWIYFYQDYIAHNHPYHVTVTCHDMPKNPTTATITAYVFYNNGTVQTMTGTFTVEPSDITTTAHSTRAPVVKGFLCGGGKMANVGGNTAIIVHNTDSLYAVYGGNDIAGWVQGEEGSTIQIGTRHTSAEHPVHIGYVYGGGCGFYTYQGLNVGVVKDNNGNDMVVDPYVYNGLKTNLEYQAYFFNGKVYKWNSLPSDYAEKANQVVQRYSEVAAGTGSWTDEEIMQGYYEAAWNDDDLVVDHTFSYIPYYYCNESTQQASITPGESTENVDNTENGNGTACMADKSYMGLVPYIKTAHVMVGVPEVDGHNDDFGDNAHIHNDHILIDSLFGGSENAFIGVTTNSGDLMSAITVDINGGTILSVFGGNNYGGSIANTAMTLVNVHCTKLTDDEHFRENAYYHGFGRDFGIRHLFGGGNLVDSPHSQVTFTGGMVDTAFVGGNMATVHNPIGIVNCQSDDKVYNSAGQYIGAAGAAGLMNGHFIYTNPTLGDTANMKNDQYQVLHAVGDPVLDENGDPTYEADGVTPVLYTQEVRRAYTPDMGLYNVHSLFGGNNMAPMDNLSFVQLLSGGVCTVYGGGNNGDMDNDASIAQASTDHMSYIDIAPMVSSMNGIFNQSTLISWPDKVGSVIAASEHSRIIADYIHGGCRQANVKHSCIVYLTGGSYYDVWGGNDVSGDVGSELDGATYAVITGNAIVHANVYGGNDGYYYCEDPDNPGHYSNNKMGMDPFNPEYDYDPYGDMIGLLLPTQQHSNVFINGGLVKGDVVGGGVYANVGFKNISANPKIQYFGEAEKDMAGVSKVKGTVRLEIAGEAKIHGNVFGGGSFASIYGLSQVYVHETPVILGSLFAGNDCLGNIQSHLPYQSNMDNDQNPYSYYAYYYKDVYSAGTDAIATTHADSLAYYNEHPLTDEQKLAAESWNQANQTSSDGDSLNFYTTTVNGIKQYNPKYSTYLLIEDKPVINSVYGSGNGAWNYDNDPSSPFPSTYVCPGQSGADNRPNQASAFIDIHTSGGFIDTVFGGGAGCSVERDVVVMLNNKTIDNPAYPDTMAAIRTLSASLGRNFVGGTSREEAGVAGTNFVGTIFGGNNFSEMNIVPEIRLVKGNVKNVYGGGNSGEMIGTVTALDICGNDVPNVSTHIVSESENITVTDSVFGGCRMSDIEGMAYVEVRNTTEKGIQYLYGGNDISGNIKGNTRIDMSGGLVKRMWGGSNGRYDYVPVGYEMYNVYKFGTYNDAHPETGIIATAAKPNIDSTSVNLWGGTIDASVFAGGSMADCRTTCLTVNDLVGCSGTGDITINGAIYGGGEGRWDDLNARDLEGNRWGNINGSTNVHLYHAKEVTSAVAYGGGGGGDVYNTNITTYAEWDNTFKAMYGGCWGSDVYGTAHLEFNGKNLVNNLFGGNDFTGNVYRSEIVVNSGIFYNVYGGGNGDYPDSYYTSQHPNALTAEFAYQHARPTAYAGTRHLGRPNTEYVTITFNDGVVDSCLYGGGKMGTVYPNKKDASGAYEYEYADTTDNGIDDGDLQRFIHDIDRDMAHTVDDPTDFSYIVVNIHGGKFHRNVFGGGRGYKIDKTPIVHGLKIVNMDGGEIYESLYGGSEFINDGYPAECDVPKDGSGDPISDPTIQQQLAATTMRPSSIVNITGGIVGANFYGTGYQGMVYGSSYVNIGPDAIDSCTVWRNTYGTDTEDSTYKMFKPGYKGGYSDELETNKLVFKNSIYSGANWGLASGEITFDNPGFIGGESRIYIDGNGYNTLNSNVSADPEFDIIRSIYGSGTSVLGGDIHSHIEVRNYGGMANCHPTKTIETIQRTDSLWLHNTAIILTGTTDASQQYMSNRYAIKNVEQMNYRGYNVTELQAAADHVENLGFFEQGTTSAVHTAAQFDTIEVPVSDLNSQVDRASCGDNVDVCDKEYVVSPTEPTKRHTLIILNNGVNLNIGDGTNYGAITGFGYVVTPGGYQSTITARPKLVLGSNDSQYNSADGGFVASCQDSNMTRNLSSSISDINPNWNDATASAAATDEIRYTNHASANAQGFTGDKLFREWKVGDKHGLRQAEATLLAHTDPSKLEQDWSVMLNCGASPNVTLNQKMGIAEAAFELPATTAGHYYQLIGEGFEMTGSNGEIELVDSAWYPILNSTLANGGNLNMGSALSTISNWYTTGHLDANTNGEWMEIPNGNPSEMEGTKQIMITPEHTFGLVMVPDGNFATVENSGNYEFNMPASVDHDNDPLTVNITPDQDWAYFIINGNARVNSVNHYCSPKVFDNNDPSNPEIKPSMRLYLTYDTSFTTTFNGTVTFKMMEYDEAGNEVAPILVKVYIQTIIGELKDMEQNVMAMYNGGRTNTFTRKVELVPCGEERDLYITGIRWLPTDENGVNATAEACTTAFDKKDRFSLLPDTLQVQATSSGYPHDVSSGHPGDNDHSSHNRFAMSIIPSNNMSEDASMANGWIRGTGIRTNLYKLAYPSGTEAVKTCEWSNEDDSVAIFSLKNKNGNDEHGYFLGTLDGRGSSVIDVELGFDGTRVYDAMDGKGYVGKVILTLETRTTEGDESRGTFNVTIYVKTREHGDTIYMASADSVTRQVAPNKSITVWPYSNVEHNDPASFTKNQIGKTPSLYVQSFRKALEDGIYQEGDVLCIIDTVKIDNTPVHITGPNGPPIEVVRYDGHHRQLPDEQSVYRGPMILVQNGGIFTAENIAFHGGAGSQITKIVRESCSCADGTNDCCNADLDGSGNMQYVSSHTLTVGGETYNFTNDKRPDTNMVWSPIIVATGANSTSGDISTVNLREGTIVQHNWNGYGHGSGQMTDGMPTDTKNMGAISVTDDAILTIAGNVTVEYNFSHTMTGLDDITHDSVSVQKAPGNGAIYVDGGTIELPESNRNSAINITGNYLMNPNVHSGSASWWDVYTVNGKPERFIINPNDLAGWHRANVLLTRTEESPADPSGMTAQQIAYHKKLNDEQSDVIIISGTMGDNTQIGVRKWFPGIHERDTIRIAVGKGGNNTLLANVVENNSLLSDDHFDVFYNSKVDLSTIYLFRCATFRHQLAADNFIGPLYDGYGLELKSNDVLHFGVMDNVCPTGGDSIIYRVQGGLMPYNFTWSDPAKIVTLSSRTTSYNNAQVEADLENTSLSAAERYAKYAASMADTLLLPNESVTPKTDRKWNHLLVTATDATGECVLYKNIDLRIKMLHEATDPVTYWPKTTAEDTASHRDNSSPWQNDTVGTGWTDTSRTVNAVASRNFKGVRITPKVWVERSQGTISATVGGEDPIDDYIYQFVDNETSHELANLNFCPGDTIFLYTEPRGENSHFIMWDFDPYYRQLALYIVPPHDATVTAYYGPETYWHQHIKNTEDADAIYDNNYNYAGNNGHSFVNTYNGDVHIYDEKGLAWLISRVNGLNGQQARSFRFNRVLIHAKSDGEPYDMKNYLWYPIGSEQHPFMGRIFGVSSNATDNLPWSGISGTDTTWHAPVVIKNIIVNEPNMYSAGLFGYMDSAGLYNIDIQGELVRGSQYVGGLAGTSAHSYVRRSKVQSDVEDADLTTGFGDQIPTTILTSHYVTGGMLGKSKLDTVTASEVAVKFVGDAVYSGGGIGYGSGSYIYNVTGHNFTRQQGLYLGGIAGFLNDTMPYNNYPTTLIGRLFAGRKATPVPSKVMNNYVRITSEGNPQRLGGVVGYSTNTIIENNYIYGDLNASHVGGVTALAANGTQANYNYYASAAASKPSYRTQGTANLGLTADFDGQGNQVTISQSAYGTDNLTRALNLWVREHNANGGDYFTWRSAVDNENSGYPVFGRPDLIPIFGDSVVLEGCEVVVWNGIAYTADAVITNRFIDSVAMTDSMVSTVIRIHHSTQTEFADSAYLDQDYSGHGFFVSSTEAQLLQRTVDSLGSATIVLSDTLHTAFGCDSVVTLTLIFTDTVNHSGNVDVVSPTEVPYTIKVYPNPTLDYVNVEAEGMSHVEVYDNEGRRLQDYDANGSDKVVVDMTSYVTGVYYVRIHSPHGVTIQKIIKQR